MFGRLVAGLVVVGLAVGVWAMWPESGPDPTTTTVAEEPTTSLATTTSPPSSSTTTVPGDANVVETVAEAEAILRQLWFGWFEGIYEQDEERIKEVVASQSQLDSAIAAFGAPFTTAPTPEGITFEDTTILRSDTECLAVSGQIDVSAFRGEGAIASSVEVLRWSDGEWKFVATWQDEADLWEQDCETQLEPLS